MSIRFQEFVATLFTSAYILNAEGLKVCGTYVLHVKSPHQTARAMEGLDCWEEVILPLLLIS